MFDYIDPENSYMCFINLFLKQYVENRKKEYKTANMNPLNLKKM